MPKNSWSLAHSLKVFFFSIMHKTRLHNREGLNYNECRSGNFNATFYLERTVPIFVDSITLVFIFYHSLYRLVIRLGNCSFNMNMNSSLYLCISIYYQRAQFSSCFRLLNHSFICKYCEERTESRKQLDSINTCKLFQK